MLVLARQVGEDLVIDGRIVVKVLSVRGRRVRLGVATSPFATVDRGEVHRRRADPPPSPPSAPRREVPELRPGVALLGSVTPMKGIEDVTAKVIRVLSEALNVDEDEINPSSTLQGDL